MSTTPTYHTGGSTYSVPTAAQGDDRVYGTFRNCAVLGHWCTIHVDRLPDGDPQVADMLGFGGVFTRGGVAIHISGKDDYGAKTGPGFIRAIGLYRVEWIGAGDHAAGLGCYKPEPAVIASWDSGPAGNGHRSNIWQHHAFFGGASHFVALKGVYRWWQVHRRGFGAQDVCEAIDNVRGHKRGDTGSVQDRQHISAVRRLLDGCVNVQSVATPLGAMLVRVGRWTYAFEEQP